MRQTVLLVTESRPEQQREIRALFQASSEYELLAVVVPLSAGPMVLALKPDLVALDPRLNDPGGVERTLTEQHPRVRIGSLVRSPLHILPHRWSQDPRPMDAPKRVSPKHGKARVLVVMTASTGGPDALSTVLSALPSNFLPPILLAQHISPGMERSLVAGLQERSGRDIRVAGRNDPLQQGIVYVAPSERHLVLSASTGSLQLNLSNAPPEHSCRPAADVLFRSVAPLLGARTVAVVLTGIGEDGTAGCRALSAEGALVIAQDEATSTAWGMPGNVIKNGWASEVLPLDKIGARLGAMPFVSLSTSERETC